MGKKLEMRERNIMKKQIERKIKTLISCIKKTVKLHTQFVLPVDSQELYLNFSYLFIF